MSTIGLALRNTRISRKKIENFPAPYILYETVSDTSETLIRPDPRPVPPAGTHPCRALSHHCYKSSPRRQACTGVSSATALRCPPRVPSPRHDTPACSPAPFAQIYAYVFSCFFRLFLASESLIDGLLHLLGVKSSQDHFWRFQLKTNSEQKLPKKIPGRRW